MAVYHARPRDDGQWEAKKEGAKRAALVGSKVQAISKVDSITDPGDIKVIHNPDGSVQKREKQTKTRKNNQRRGKKQLGGGLFDNF